MARNLPIQIFSARVIDHQKPEKGGGGTPPAWLLKGDDLIARAEELIGQAEAVSDTLRSRETEKNFTPVVMRVKTHRKAIAKSHRIPVEDLLNPPEKRNVVGLVGDYDLLLKLDSPKDVTLLKQKLADTRKYATAVSAVLSIDRYTPTNELPEDFDGVVKIKLHNFQDRELNSAALKFFMKQCDRLKLSYRIALYTPRLAVCAVENVDDADFNNWTLDSISELVKTGAIYSISPMPEYAQDEAELIGITQTVPVLHPKKGVEYPTLGMLDSGIAKIPHLTPWIADRNHTNYLDEGDIDRRHGTFVAGRAVYADSFHGQELVGVGGFRLFEAIVFPAGRGRVTELELMDNVREAIEANPDIPVWCMPLGSTRECEPDRPSDFGVFLDNIQEKFPNILIVKSAGNTYAFIDDAPRGFLRQSADSVRSLVVGSIAHIKENGDLAEVNHASPFTPSGFGPGSLVNPDLTHYGGNAKVINGEAVASGVPSFGIDGSTVRDSGVSFSTPLVAALTIGLHHKIDEANPILLKALATHSATYPANLSYEPNERLPLLGHGVPKPLNDILYNDQNEITLILQDSLQNGEWRHILDFPYPKCLIRDGKYYGEITATLVTDPILDFTQGIEYCQTNIDVFMGTYDSKINFKPEDKRRNPLGREGGQNLLMPSLRGSSKKGERGERYLLANAGKFHPTKKWVQDLSLFTPTNREKFLNGDRKWFLKLEALYRANTEINYDRPPVGFCLVITIRDPERQGKVYNETIRLLDQFGFVRSEIKLRSDVKVKAKISR